MKVKNKSISCERCVFSVSVFLLEYPQFNDQKLVSAQPEYVLNKGNNDAKGSLKVVWRDILVLIKNEWYQNT